MRIIIVANRLPFTIAMRGTEVVLKPSAGGLASGMEAFTKILGQQASYTWIGWPGTVDTMHQSEVSRLAKRDYNSLPLFMTKDDEENFYLGFCNKILWPLFHYFPTYCDYKETYWQSYKKINLHYAEQIEKIAQPGDYLFIQDYHFMLLPSLLRQKLPNTSIGFFLHTPFPSYELFQMLPAAWRTELLEGVLGANLIGFHTDEYKNHFLQTARRLRGYTHHMNSIMHNEQITQVESFPLGIDIKKFTEMAETKTMREKTKSLQQTFQNKKIILSVDRLDYTKGIAKRLAAFDLFLEKHPEWQKKVVLLVVAVPSRTEILAYQNMKQEIEELVGKINGKYTDAQWTPIIYQYKSLAFEDLLTYYTVSDVALITPVYDGMNLIAKEYVASKIDQTGCLILSEFTGSAKEMQEALLVNPNSEMEMVTAIQTALEMSKKEQNERMFVLQDKLQTNDITRWTKRIYTAFTQITQQQQHDTITIINRWMKKDLLADYARAKKRLLLLDYDGTLVPFARHPDLAMPPQMIREYLTILGSNPCNTVILTSGRERKTLDRWFGDLPIQLSAEHGAWVKQNHWKLLLPQMGVWKKTIQSILTQYMQRVPGSFIEEKEYSLAWHYRSTPLNDNGTLVAEMTDNLLLMAANSGLEIMHGNKVIEVKPASYNKGSNLPYLIEKEKFDFIMAIGDDLTDESLFAILPDSAYSIKVGEVKSNARFSLKDVWQVRELLKIIIANSPKPTPQLFTQFAPA